MPTEDAEVQSLRLGVECVINPEIADAGILLFQFWVEQHR